jgi:hypothetical protein
MTHSNSPYEKLCLAKRVLLAQEKDVLRAAAIAIESQLNDHYGGGQGPATGQISVSRLGQSWAAEDNLPAVQLRWLAQWCREGMADSATSQDCASVWRRLYDVRRLDEFRENGKRQATVHPDVRNVLLNVFGPVTDLEHSQFQRPSLAVQPFDFSEATPVATFVPAKRKRT